MADDLFSAVTPSKRRHDDITLMLNQAVSSAGAVEAIVHFPEVDRIPAQTLIADMLDAVRDIDGRCLCDDSAHREMSEAVTLVGEASDSGDLSRLAAATATVAEKFRRHCDASFKDGRWRYLRYQARTHWERPVQLTPLRTIGFVDLQTDGVLGSYAFEIKPSWPMLSEVIRQVNRYRTARRDWTYVVVADEDERKATVLKQNGIRFLSIQALERATS